jgi:hypothetical protein
VDGRYKETPQGGIKCERMTFLLDASNSNEAWAAGEQHAEIVAKVGPKWISFETVQVASVELPLQL